MDLVRDMEPRSGLDLVDPAHLPVAGRTTPTLLVLPRGHFYGGRSGHGYSFPALQLPGAMAVLVDDALRRFAAAAGVQATRGRLILTAHSGGGSALMAIMRYLDPDEVHTFDALYADPAPLIAWARRREASGAGAMRVLFRRGRGPPRTAFGSTAIRRPPPRFRVEQTTVPHIAIPRTFGWRLLANPAANLPGGPRRTRCPIPTGRRQGQLRELVPRQRAAPGAAFRCASRWRASPVNNT